MKIISTLALTVVLVTLGAFTAQAQIEGGAFGDKHDRFIINSDESDHDAAIRLQTKYNNYYRDWNIWNNRQDGRLFFSYWGSSSHSDSNEDDIGSYRMTLTSGGNLGIGKTSPSYKVHAGGDIYADGGWMRVSGQRGLYFQSYGGGFYMTDNTWIRTYGNKSFYHNSGTMRTDGTFQVGNNGGRFLVKTDGKVGVGTTSPSAALHVAARSGTSPAENGVYVYQSSTNKHAIVSARVNANGSGDPFFSMDVSGEAGWSMGLDNNDGNKYKIASSWSSLSSSTRMTIDHSNGNVGIGTTSPSEKLHVSGNVKTTGTVTANSFTVTVGTFPDYVFAPSYELMNLYDVEAYINANRHLPKVPTEAEVLENGMDIGQINVLLTEKVEELTLYTIQQQKEIDELKALVQQMLDSND